MLLALDVTAQVVTIKMSSIPLTESGLGLFAFWEIVKSVFKVLLWLSGVF